jgi:hypothetical protein
MQQGTSGQLTMKHVVFWVVVVLIALVVCLPFYYSAREMEDSDDENG